MTHAGTCLASRDHPLTRHSYELCPFCTRLARWPAGLALLTSGMPHGLESQRGTQPGTRTPSKRAVTHMHRVYLGSSWYPSCMRAVPGSVLGRDPGPLQTLRHPFSSFCGLLTCRDFYELAL